MAVMTWYQRGALCTLLWVLLSGQVVQAGLSPDDPSQARHARAWAQLVADATAMGLPTGFLAAIKPGFVSIEFEALRSFAAEYHPDGHRMVLNRSLSLNSAGAALRPVSQLSHGDLATLYHELFHAYMDYITSTPGATAHAPQSASLLAFAREQQHCRYQKVRITPVPGRKTHTEGRVLTEQESWEALNETWAVFVGWAVWTQLEVAGRSGGGKDQDDGLPPEWLDRLAKADQEGSLTGFYEPQRPDERAMTHKRYLAPSYRISPIEVAALLELVFDKPPEAVRRAAAAMTQTRARGPRHAECLP